MIPVIVISLARSPERRASIRARLDALGVPFAFIDAVDGQLLSDAEVARLCPGRYRIYRRWPLSPAEIACTASHMAALRKIVDEGYDFACVLEDDAAPDSSFPEFLDPQWLATLPPFDLLKLACDSANPNDFRAVPIGTRANHTICVPLHPTYSAMAYIASRDGARRTLNRSRTVVETADVFMFRQPSPTARILDVRISPVVTGGAASTIRGNRLATSFAWWPIVSWLPHRLYLLQRPLRRRLAFLLWQGFAGFRRLQNLPFRAPKPPAASP